MIPASVIDVNGLELRGRRNVGRAVNNAYGIRLSAVSRFVSAFARTEV